MTGIYDDLTDEELEERLREALSELAIWEERRTDIRDELQRRAFARPERAPRR